MTVDTHEPSSSPEVPVDFQELYSTVDSIFQSPDYLKAVAEVMIANPHGRDNIREVTLTKNGFDWTLPIRINEGVRRVNRRRTHQVAANEVYGQLRLGNTEDINLTVNDEIELRTNLDGKGEYSWERRVYPLCSPVDPDLQEAKVWNNNQAAEAIKNMVAEFHAPEVETRPLDSDEKQAGSDEPVVVFEAENFHLAPESEFLSPNQMIDRAYKEIIKHPLFARYHDQHVVIVRPEGEKPYILLMTSTIYYDEETSNELLRLARSFEGVDIRFHHLQYSHLNEALGVQGPGAEYYDRPY